MTIKDWKYVKINSVNPLYLIFNKVNGYFEEINETNELKETDVKNRTYYYFDNIMRDTDINFTDILLHQKSNQNKYENTLIYDISYKTFKGSIPFPIRFDEIDGFIKIYDRIRYLVLFDYGWCDKIYDRIKYLISEKSGFTDSINHNFGRIRIDSYYS